MGHQDTMIKALTCLKAVSEDHIETIVLLINKNLSNVRNAEW